MRNATSFAVVLLAVAAAAAAPNRAAATTVGAKVGISNGGLSAVVGDLKDPLENAIGHLKIPDYRTSHVHLQNMRTENFKCDDPCFEVAVGSGNQIKIEIKKFELGFHVRYSLHEIISTGGVCDFKLHDSHASITSTVSVGGGKVSIGSINSDISLGHLDTGCKGVSGAVINVIGDLFSKKIESMIEDAAKKALEGTVTKQIDDALAKVTWDVPFADKYAQANFDPASVSSSSSTLSLGVLGDVTQIGKPATKIPFSVPSMPMWDSSADSAYLQVMLSSWSLESYGYTYFEGGRLQRVIPNSEVNLNTGILSIFAPGLKSKYPDRKMQMMLKAMGPPAVTMSASKGLSVTLPTDLVFQVLDATGKSVEAPAFTLGANATAGISTSVTGSSSSQRIAGKITSLSVPFQVASSQVGPVHLVAGLFNITNSLLDNIVVPAVNAVLAQGFPLPTVEGISLKNTVLSQKEGYLLLATQFSL